MRSREALVVAILLLLLSGTPVQARTVGISPNDQVTYSQTERTINYAAVNTTTFFSSQFTLQVLGLNTSVTPAIVAYSFRVDIQNGTAVTSESTATNYTTVFDPFDNRTYVAGNFFPFIYTDVKNGSRTNLQVNVPVNGTIYKIVNGTRYEFPPVLLNSSVVRSPTTIYVAVAINPGIQAPPFTWVLDYNATNGVLEKGTITIGQFDVTRIFTFALVSYQRAPPSNLSLILYIIIAVIVVVVAVAVLTRTKGSVRAQRRARMREKFKILRQREYHFMR